MRRLSTALIAFTFFLGLAGKAEAQRAISSDDPGQWALLYAKNLEKNKAALSNYTWQYSFEVMQDSEVLYVDLLEAQIDSGGNLQLNRLEHDLKIKQRHGPLSKAGQEGRLKNIQEKIDFLTATIRRYVYLEKGELVDFFDKAEKTEAVGYSNAIRLDGEDIINTGDSITLFGDRATAHPIFMTFSVPFDHMFEVDCAIQFRHLRGSGLFYAAEVTANFVELKRLGGPKALSIEVESFDFQKK
ncbi:MAG: hypothetical protein HRU46_03810 [Verrucomicrobiales bacterium]|nr:hypothetical protein [Verrucomicrobiales bacterium]